MGISKTSEISVTTKLGYDRASELKAFDETKDGVKGFVDASITQVPRMFHHEIDKDSASSSSSTTKLVVPFVDLADIHLDPTRRKTVEKIREASETWGFFQVVNHGIDIIVLDEMKNGVINFFDFITVLLQDHIGGLQVLHENNWVDVSSIPGALVINIGDLQQLITNDIFKSVEHRVVANYVGPRVSVASFFSTSFQPSTKLYGPIKALLSEENPPKYKEITVHDYVVFSMARGHDGTSPLPYFRV